MLAAHLTIVTGGDLIEEKNGARTINEMRDNQIKVDPKNIEIDS
jgi:hypothetical protein